MKYFVSFSLGVVLTIMWFLYIVIPSKQPTVKTQKEIPFTKSNTTKVRWKDVHTVDTLATDIDRSLRTLYDTSGKPIESVTWGADKKFTWVKDTIRNCGKDTIRDSVRYFDTKDFGGNDCGDNTDALIGIIDYMQMLSNHSFHINVRGNYDPILLAQHWYDKGRKHQQELDIEKLK